ncbi:Panacea domain-containing protein [Anaerovibrio sp.]|uniref:Panacea domain-containing protein n=1 Tax=Anaerovibrio sp. TaxID=1872532 RepID=UPI00388E8E4C
MDARKVAEYITQKYYITNPKLQNVLYFIQAKYLLELNKPCFEQTMEARSTGIIVEDVFNEYKLYEGGLIPHDSDSIPDIGDSSLIDEVVKQCNKKSFAQLRDIITRQTPWKEAYNNGYQPEITLDSMKEYFQD